MIKLLRITFLDFINILKKGLPLLVTLFVLLVSGITFSKDNRTANIFGYKHYFKKDMYSFVNARKYKVCFPALDYRSLSAHLMQLFSISKDFSFKHENNSLRLKRASLNNHGYVSLLTKSKLLHYRI